MSSEKLVHICTIGLAAIYEQKIAALIAEVLRREHPAGTVAIKNISKKTGVRCSTVRRWYEGRNPPSLGHFLLLVYHFPAIRDAALGLTWPMSFREVTRRHLTGAATEQSEASDGKIYCATLHNKSKFNPLSAERSPANRRKWFLETLRQGTRIRAADIAKKYAVSARTSRSDIAKLVEWGLIRFVGARRGGFYEPI